MIKWLGGKNPSDLGFKIGDRKRAKVPVRRFHLLVPNLQFSSRNLTRMKGHHQWQQSVPKTIGLTGHLGQWQALIYWPKPGFTGPNNWHNTISTKFAYASPASGRVLIIGLIGNRLANGVGPVLISQTVTVAIATAAWRHTHWNKTQTIDGTFYNHYWKLAVQCDHWPSRSTSSQPFHLWKFFSL